MSDSWKELGHEPESCGNKIVTTVHKFINIYKFANLPEDSEMKYYSSGSVYSSEDRARANAGTGYHATVPVSIPLDKEK